MLRKNTKFVISFPDQISKKLDADNIFTPSSVPDLLESNFPLLIRNFKWLTISNYNYS